MSLRFADLMFTPAVCAEQERHGSRAAYARFDMPDAPARDCFGPREAEFIAARDSFYMASVSETGWPYVQHRGGPPGFLKLLDARTLAFADYRGNRQYVSLGNVRTDDRVALILMDYANRARLKVLGHATAIDTGADPELFTRLAVPGATAPVERAFLIRIEGFDWNCPQHITPRFTQAELAAVLEPVSARIAALEQENAALRARLARPERPAR